MLNLSLFFDTDNRLAEFLKVSEEVIKNFGGILAFKFDIFYQEYTNKEDGKYQISRLGSLFDINAELDGLPTFKLIHYICMGHCYDQIKILPKKTDFEVFAQNALVNAVYLQKSQTGLMVFYQADNIWLKDEITDQYSISKIFHFMKDKAELDFKEKHKVFIDIIRQLRRFLPLFPVNLEHTLTTLNKINVHQKTCLDSKGASPLHWALRSNLPLAGITCLIQLDYLNDVNDNFEETNLHIACKYSNSDVVKYLINISSTQLQKKNKLEQTPLHLTALNDDFGVIKYLIEEQKIDKADLLQVDKNENSWMHLACCFNSNVNVIVYGMIKLDLDINTSKKNGNTLLHLACKYNPSLFVVNSLVNLGADFNMINEDGDTPLHLVCKHSKNETIIRYLAQETGMDINKKNKKGLMAVNYIEKDTTLDFEIKHRIIEIFTKKSHRKNEIVEISSLENDEEINNLLSCIRNKNELPVINFVKNNPNIFWIKEESVLHLAIRYGCYKIVAYYLIEAENIFLDLRTFDDKKTYFHLAIERAKNHPNEHDCFKIIGYLLEETRPENTDKTIHEFDDFVKQSKVIHDNLLALHKLLVIHQLLPLPDSNNSSPVIIVRNSGNQSDVRQKPTQLPTKLYEEKDIDREQLSKYFHNGRLTLFNKRPLSQFDMSRRIMLERMEEAHRSSSPFSGFPCYSD